MKRAMPQRGLSQKRGAAYPDTSVVYYHDSLILSCPVNTDEKNSGSTVSSDEKTEQEPEQPSGAEAQQLFTDMAEQEHALRESRHLATLQEIRKIEEIPNADNLQIATVLGWRVCVRKGEYKPGDMTVYCEVDSVLPAVAEFEFLKKRKYRIKMARLCGVYSQGICIQPKDLVEGKSFNVRWASEGKRGLVFMGESSSSAKEPSAESGKPDDEGQFKTIGDDITSLLNITKYAPSEPDHLKGVRSEFPDFIAKTEEINIQADPDMAQAFAGAETGGIYITEKMDGTSCTMYLYRGTFGICSRNLDIREGKNNTYWKAARELDIESKLREAQLDNIAIQGELCGPKIQGNHYHLENQQWFVFNVYDIGTREYYNFDQWLKLVDNLGLRHVPLLENPKQDIADIPVQEWVRISSGHSELYPVVWREGIVVRARNVNVRDRKGRRLSFKVISEKYSFEKKE